MATLGDADRYSDIKLELTCPHCATAGLIPLARLDRVLYCSGCLRWFRVEPHGLVEVESPAEERISVQVRSNSSQWHAHRAVIEKELTCNERLRNAALDLAANNVARVAAVCAALGLIAAAIALTPSAPSKPQPRELPTGLKERAALLTEALARRDMATLIALTDPSQHRALRIWLAHAAELPAQVAAETASIEAQVLSTAETSADGKTVDVRVRLRTASDPKELVLDERWAQAGEVWYFRPVRLRAQAQPVARPPTGKQRQRALR